MTVKEMAKKLQDVADKYGDCDLTIIIDGSACNFSDVRVNGVGGFTDATIICTHNDMREVNKARSVSNKSRCHKCLYSNECHDTNQAGDCKKYKLDPPDGGYYG